MEPKEIKIKKLVIKIGQTEVNVTPEEAKELHKALDEMFGKEIVREVYHDWWYRTPIYTNVPTFPGIVYCSGTTTSNNAITITAQE